MSVLVLLFVSFNTAIPAAGEETSGLKPIIESVRVDSIVDNNPLYSYNLHFTVQYKGADKIKVSLEEEYNTIVRTWYYYEPHLVSGVVERIISPYCAWIDFTAKNEYGKAVVTIELGPYGEIIDIKGDLAHVDMCETEPVADNIEVYDASGVIVCVVERMSDLSSLSGFFILRLIKDGALLRTTKVML